ncbi:MAG: hypothetical protein LBC69_00380, partial [Eubacteriaceae bacterium]|nr:hypothetical protein [Eubacteriaceae bacterium]
GTIAACACYNFIIAQGFPLSKGAGLQRAQGKSRRQFEKKRPAPKERQNWLFHSAGISILHKLERGS